MAKNIQISKKMKTTSQSSVVWQFPLDKNDLMYIGVGLGIILLGYLLMYTGVTEEPAVPDGKWNNPLAITVAPILLVLGYCVVIPMAILKMFRKKASNPKEETAS